jgi:GTP-binding protein Era
MNETKVRRCGYAALIGAPNAGKSTLLNALAGHKLSIVSPKPQTTRGPVRAIVQHERSQIVFIDTAGIFEAKPRFEKAMVEAAWSGAADADEILVLVDAKKALRSAEIDADTALILQGLRARERAASLVLNKTDLVEKPRLLALAQRLYDAFSFERSFMIAAVKGQGVPDILHWLAGRMPEHPWLYPEEQLTEMSERALAAELTRETCFHILQAELPYQLMVETEKWEEMEKAGARHLKIHQVISVERESHKKILLGARGEMLKTIGRRARYAIGQSLGAQAHLFLFVKVSPGWKEKEDALRSAGLDHTP